jgi:hypothetical protein
MRKLRLNVQLTGHLRIYRQISDHFSGVPAIEGVVDFGSRGSLHGRVRRRLGRHGWPTFGSSTSDQRAVSGSRRGSITGAISDGITCYRVRNYLPVLLATCRASAAISCCTTPPRSVRATRTRAVSARLWRVGAGADDPDRARTRSRVRRLPGRVDLGDEAQVAPTSPLTRLAKSTRPSVGEPGGAR